MRVVLLTFSVVLAIPAFGAYKPEAARSIMTTVKIFKDGKLLDQPQIISLENEPATIEVGDERTAPFLKLTVDVVVTGKQTNAEEDLEIEMSLDKIIGKKVHKISTTVVMPSGSDVLLPLSQKDHLYFTMHSELMAADDQSN